MLPSPASAVAAGVLVRWSVAAGLVAAWSPGVGDCVGEGDACGDSDVTVVVGLGDWAVVGAASSVEPQLVTVRAAPMATAQNRVHERRGRADARGTDGAGCGSNIFG
ncbi:hypothetical protein [Kocuria sp.]|uniref:hypothetical protein n=1 Tax=Kocuria sp. TaxID=1871328 RepID=UPI0026DFDCC0|nr:hypothetical protein [Kocuria sp.]MDO5619339.1 hypothetical protein [Kocuria sp.]